MAPTLAKIAEGGADALTMNKGVACGIWVSCGRIPLIIQSMALRPSLNPILPIPLQ